jgi:hypothetical protein
MKYIMKISSVILFSALIVFIGCQKGTNGGGNGGGNNGGTGNNLSEPNPVTATVTGLIVNENDLPLAGASVKSGTNSATTDSRGYFTFKNIGLDKFTAMVNVNMNGYFTAYRNFSARADGVHFVKIKLIRKTLTATVTAAAGGSINLANGSQVILQPASVIVKATGQPYTGTVNVYSAYIDPTAADISATVPGSFTGIDAANQRTILQSFGMLAVDLQGSAGEALQIAANKTAKLKFTIPASLTSNAPATIPLWSINETTGIWQEEKSATKNGSFYEGDVSHFSFWNCDAPTYTIKFQMTLKTPAGAPLKNTQVRITRLNGRGSSYGYTDSLGWVGGIVPQNESLKLEVITRCNDISYSQNIGPYTADVNLGDITITPDVITTVTITGTVNNCAGQPVTNGYVQAYFDYTAYNAPITNGQFNLTFTRCSNSNANVSITATDNAANQQSTATPYNVSSGTVNTGAIAACGTSTLQFIDYTLDGTAYSFSSSNNTDSITASGLQGLRVNGNKKTFQTNLRISIASTANAIGTFPLTALIINQYSDSVTLVAPFNINVTQFGTAGQFIEGIGSGSFKDFSNVTHTLAFTFRARRQN